MTTMMMMEGSASDDNDGDLGAVDLSGDSSFDDFLSGFEGSAGAGDPPPSNVIAESGQPGSQQQPGGQQTGALGQGGQGPSGQQTTPPPQTQQTQQTQQPLPGQPDPNQQQTQQQFQQPAPGQQPQPQVSFEQYVEQNRDAIVKHMADNMFPLTAAEREAMGPVADVVPAYMARASLMTMTQIMGAMQRALPGAVAQLVNVSTDTMQRENAFFSEYPELKTVDRQMAARLAVTLRQANPQMPQEQFAPMLARTIAAYSGVTLQPTRGQPQPYAPAGGQQGGGAPQHRPSATNGRVVSSDPLYDINQALARGD